MVAVENYRVVRINGARLPMRAVRTVDEETSGDADQELIGPKPDLAYFAPCLMLGVE